MPPHNNDNLWTSGTIAGSTFITIPQTNLWSVQSLEDDQIYTVQSDLHGHTVFGIEVHSILIYSAHISRYLHSHNLGVRRY